MPLAAPGHRIHRLPAQGHEGNRLLAQALAREQQRVPGHDGVGLLADGAERNRVVQRVIDIEQEQAAQLRRFPRPVRLGLCELPLRGVLGFVFQPLHVMAKSVDQIIGELAVALPRVTEQV